MSVVATALRWPVGRQQRGCPAPLALPTSSAQRRITATPVRYSTSPPPVTGSSAGSLSCPSRRRMWPDQKVHQDERWWIAVTRLTAAVQQSRGRGLVLESQPCAPSRETLVRLVPPPCDRRYQRCGPQIGTAQVRTAQVGIHQVRTDQVSAGQIGVPQDSVTQRRPGQDGAFEVGVDQVGMGQVSVDQECAGQVRAPQIGTAQIDIAQVRRLASRQAFRQRRYRRGGHQATAPMRSTDSDRSLGSEYRMRGGFSSVTWGWEGPHAGRWGTGRKGILKVEVRGVGQRPALVVGHPPAPLVVDHRQPNVEPYPLPIIEMR